MEWIIVPILIILILLLIVSNIVIVQQSRAYVVERLGAFRTVWNVGLHLKVPFIEKGQPERAGSGLCAPACDHQG